MNRVVLVGRLTKDPDFRVTPNGVAVATFTLAIDRQFTNQQGEREADFIRCVVWRRQAENVANYLKKGNLAGVDGRIQTRNYEQDGRRVYMTEIIADSVQFLEPKGSRSGRSEAPQDSYGDQNQQQPINQSNYNRNQNQNQSQNQQQNPFDNTGQIDISDDDLPF